MDKVTIDIEYCNKCGYLNKFEELKKHIEQHANVQVNGREGRRGSFEVAINGSLVHSKLQTMAYPDNDDLGRLVDEVKEGKDMRKCREQPITSCVVS